MATARPARSSAISRGRRDPADSFRRPSIGGLTARSSLARRRFRRRAACDLRSGSSRCVVTVAILHPLTLTRHISTATLTGKAGPINIGLFTAFALFDDVFGTPGSGCASELLGMLHRYRDRSCPYRRAARASPGHGRPLDLCVVREPAMDRYRSTALVPRSGPTMQSRPDGEALLSAALPGMSTSVCPSLYSGARPRSIRDSP